MWVKRPYEHQCGYDVLLNVSDGMASFSVSVWVWRPSDCQCGNDVLMSVGEGMTFF